MKEGKGPTVHAAQIQELELSSGRTVCKARMDARRRLVINRDIHGVCVPAQQVGRLLVDAPRLLKLQVERRHRLEIQSARGGWYDGPFGNGS